MRTWSLSWNGLRTVAGLELRQRVRSKRWLAALIVWFVIIGAITWLSLTAAGTLTYRPPEVSCQTSSDGGQDCLIPITQVDRQPDQTTAFSNPICHIDPQGQIACAIETDCQIGSEECSPTTLGRPARICLAQPDGSVVCRDQTAESDNVDQLDDIVATVCQVTAAGASCRFEPLRGWQPSSGPLVFSLVALFVLGLGLVVTPALTSTSINGDRQAGTLATLQATKLSAAEIALGKLAAAWGTMLAFALAALPWLVVSAVIGGGSIWQSVVCFAVLLIELAVVCAVGLGWSALINRTSGSTLLTYSSVVVLSVLNVILIVLLAPLVNQPTTVRVWGLPPAAQREWDQRVEQYWLDYEKYDKYDQDQSAPPTFPTPPVGQCRWNDETMSLDHGERIWWLTAANPFVILADVAPKPAVALDHPDAYLNRSGDVLFLIRRTVRQVAAGPNLEYDRCPYLGATDANGTHPASPVQLRSSYDRPIWPWGLAFNLVLGVLFFWIAVRRLAVPYGRLPKDTRVA
ncbi:MAG: ABC transporter permease [Propionibacteriaceae bacterium]|jgi:ABC-type transport system involved in multi-copper enzyme maturation permease subunit|nr:ABC transporter permease [Propionibacteriaceae bacterium]